MSSPRTSTVGNVRKPYSGDRRALVLAFDVGTTFSGISYAFLNPGEIPKIQGVTRYVPFMFDFSPLQCFFFSRYPGQEHVTGNTKIPSILYYDSEGVVTAAGAEAEGASIEATAEDKEWTKVEL